MNKTRITLNVRDGYRFMFGMILAKLFWFYIPFSIFAIFVLYIYLDLII